MFHFTIDRFSGSGCVVSTALPTTCQCEQGDTDAEHKKRNTNWKSTYAEMMQTFIVTLVGS
jgi:hypothetical protein